MILVHSKQKTPAEIEAFVDAWDRDEPLVIVPTSYPELHERRIGELKKIGMVIYANHGIRAAVRAMRDAFTRSREAEAPRPFSCRSRASMSFALQNMDQISADERRFLR